MAPRSAQTAAALVAAPHVAARALWAWGAPALLPVSLALLGYVFSLYAFALALVGRHRRFLTAAVAVHLALAYWSYSGPDAAANLILAALAMVARSGQ